MDFFQFVQLLPNKIDLGACKSRGTVKGIAAKLFGHSFISLCVHSVSEGQSLILMLYNQFPTYL